MVSTNEKANLQVEICVEKQRGPSLSLEQLCKTHSAPREKKQTNTNKQKIGRVKDKNITSEMYFWIKVTL